MKLIIRWAAASFALFAAAYFVPGIHVEDPNAWTIYALMAVVLGLVNAILRPILSVLSCPFIILTLGLGMLVINSFTFWLAGRIAESLNVGFYIDRFWDAALGALIVSIIMMVVNSIIKDSRRPRKPAS